MEEPLKIVFRDISPYEEVIGAEVRELAGKLETYYDGIINCRVVVERPHKRHHSGDLYRAIVTVTVPQKQIVVSREHPFHSSHEDIFVAVQHAFKDAARQLQEYARIRSRNVKDHDRMPKGVIARIFPEDGYGFIEAPGGREIYFHGNSVLDGFSRLRIGAEVRFIEEQGEKGPQASTVKIIHKEHGHHRGH